MEHHLLGQTCALLAAILWALAMVLFKRSGEKVPPLALNLFKNTIGLVLLAITLLVMGGGFEPLRAFPREDTYILLLSGFLGVALADTVFFYALNMIGVGIISIVDCLYSPIIILLAFLILSEKLTWIHYAGAVFILAGVLISSRHPPPPGKTRGQLLVGMLLAVCALVLMGVGIVIAKPILELMDYPLIWATTLRMLTGTLPLALFAIASPDRKIWWSAFRPSPVWKYSVPGAVLGAYICMVLWIAGFKYTYASVASVLNQTTTVFALIFAALILKEPLTRRKLAAVGLALCGVLLITLAQS